MVLIYVGMVLAMMGLAGYLEMQQKCCAHCTTHHNAHSHQHIITMLVQSASFFASLLRRIKLAPGEVHYYMLLLHVTFVLLRSHMCFNVWRDGFSDEGFAGRLEALQ